MPMGRRRRGYGSLLAGLHKSVEAKRAVLCDLLARESWDLFAATFAESHCVGHQFWHFLDPGAPAPRPGGAGRLQGRHQGRLPGARPGGRRGHRGGRGRSHGARSREPRHGPLRRRLPAAAGGPDTLGLRPGGAAYQRRRRAQDQGARLVSPPARPLRLYHRGPAAFHQVRIRPAGAGLFRRAAPHPKLAPGQGDGRAQQPGRRDPPQPQGPASPTARWRRATRKATCWPNCARSSWR